MNRLLCNICVQDIEVSKKFYTDLFEFTVNYDSDWFVHLTNSQNKALELGLIKSDNEVVPQAIGNNPSGLYLTFVVDDINAIFEKVEKLNYSIIEPPKKMFYGQHRMLLRDPDGCVIDVSSIINE